MMGITAAKRKLLGLQGAGQLQALGTAIFISPARVFKLENINSFPTLYVYLENWCLMLRF